MKLDGGDVLLSDGVADPIVATVEVTKTYLSQLTLSIRFTDYKRSGGSLLPNHV